MKLLTIVGARPQFIKAAVVVHALDTFNGDRDRARQIEHVLVHTGQHYDYSMSTVFFEELDLSPPDVSLGVGSGPHGAQTGEMMARLEPVLVEQRPDVVVVYGDTNSTLAGALTAAKLHIPLCHVEAGLRSFNRSMPEEINRVVADHLADVLFCPTETAVANLVREGITRGVHLVGDVMHESALHYLGRAQQRSHVLDDLNLKGRTYALATIHRAENTDDPVRLVGLASALAGVARTRPVVWPVHPRAEKALRVAGVTTSAGGLILAPPAPYLDMLTLVKNADIVLTDSGGVQREAYWLGVPCVTLRDETEWTETVSSGWNVIAGTEPEGILAAVSHFSNAWMPAQEPPPPPQAGMQILSVLFADQPLPRSRDKGAHG